MAFIRKIKTSSGATAVQIAYKAHGKIVRMEHIGSAHSEDELNLLIALAKKKMTESQPSLFGVDPKLKIGLRDSFSDLLLQVLTDQYKRLSFSKLDDEDFANLCFARIVEPTSKLDSLRVLTDLGIKGLDVTRLYRCLKRG